MTKILINRAEKITLEQETECSSCREEWVKTGFQLSGRLNQFVCKKCYKSKFRHEYPESGKEVDIDNAPATPNKDRIHKLTKLLTSRKARMGVAIVVALIILYFVISNVLNKGPSVEPQKPTIKMVARPAAPAPASPAPKPEKSAKEEKLTSVENAITEGSDLYECRENSMKGKAQYAPILYTNLTQNCRDAIKYQQVVYMGGGTLPCKGDICKPQKQIISAEKGKESRAIRAGGKNMQETDISDEIIIKLSQEIRNNQSNAYLYNNRGSQFAYLGYYKKSIDDFRVACEKGLEIGCENLRIALKYSQ